MQNFQDFILSLSRYWMDYGCIWSQPYDSSMGAGTFHPHTFLKGIGPEPWRAVYVQPCRRPVDGRYGKSPYRFQHYYQLQVILKPAPANIVDVFLKSLEHVGINLKDNDISLLEDNWEGPTLGAWGLGWEVRANGQEVTQFTYFQQLGGLNLDVVPGEITYGLERLYMYAHGLKSAQEIQFNEHFTWGEIYTQNEFEFSHFNFTEASVPELLKYFDQCEATVEKLCAKNLVLPAYDYVLQASHAFNLLDARGAVSVNERQRYIGRVRECAKRCATIYSTEREKLKYPMLNCLDNDPRQVFLKKGEKKVELALGSSALPVLTAQDKVTTLFELGVEEIPPSFLQILEEDLTRKVGDFWESEKQKFKDETKFSELLGQVESRVFASPRRIALLVENMPAMEPSLNVVLWGPAERIAKTADGKLSQAGLGFCRKNGIPEADAIFKEKSDGVFLYAEKKAQGRRLSEVLGQELKVWLEQISSGVKRMKWLPEDVSPSFIRPVRWIVALENDQVIPVEMYGLKSSRFTCGQRILAPDYFEFKHASEYETQIKKLFVEPSWEARKERILNEAEKLARDVGGTLVEDEGLLHKLTGLSEDPAPFVGHIDEKYMALPRGLVTSVLREHMNYFAIAGADGKLIPHYVGVASYNCGKPESMAAGTENVVTGRLDDGTFYYDTDLKTPLAELREKLKNQLFQANLGTLFEKSERVAVLASRLAEKISTSDKNFVESAKLAGAYCKADLRTGCVQEFPDEMQGVMGGILINHQNTFGAHSKEVAAAVSEHYKPSGASSPLPETVLGQVVSLADKLDSLVMFVNGGMDPKGSKDPFGLRRLALGILRLLGMDAGEKSFFTLSLQEAYEITLSVLREFNIKVKDESLATLLDFSIGRLKAGWRGDFDANAVEAVIANAKQLNLPRGRELVSAMVAALELQGKGSLRDALVPYKRCRNLTEKGVGSGIVEVNASLFKEPQEKELFDKYQSTQLKVQSLFKEAKFKDMFTELASLGDPLQKFFDGVMVNDTDEKLKKNRLALLVNIRSIYESVADFTLVQV